jgi:hypothetical protein
MKRSPKARAQPSGATQSEADIRIVNVPCHEPKKRKSSLPKVYEWINDEWERMDLTLDSGAATSAIPVDVASRWKLTEAEGRQNYTSASQHAVNVLGQRTPRLAFMDGSVGKIKFKVLDTLGKPIVSTSALLKHGWTVVHKPNNS